MGATFTSRNLQPGPINIAEHGGCVIAEFQWTFHATFPDGQPLTTEGRETQVYWNINDRWRLAHVHYSAVPVTGGREGFERAP